MNNNKSDLPLVPESILKKRHDLEDLARKRAAATEAKGKIKAQKNDGSSRTTKTMYVKKLETILSRARSRRNHMIRYRRVQKKGMQKRASNKPQFAVKQLDDNSTKKYQTNSVGAPLVFAVRIRDGVGATKMVRKTLSMLRLQKIHDGSFLRYDEKHRKMLHLVEPWVVYGPPSKAVVVDLVERRGYGRVGGNRVPLSDNTVIEEALGQHNILCKEDLVHEICEVGEHFDDAIAFLWPFQLADNKTEFERKTLKLKDGKDYGDRGEAISDFIQEVL